MHACLHEVRGKGKGLLPAQPREEPARLPHVPRPASPGSWRKQLRKPSCPVLHKGLSPALKLSTEAHFKISHVLAGASGPVSQVSKRTMRPSRTLLSASDRNGVLMAKEGQLTPPRRREVSQVRSGCRELLLLRRRMDPYQATLHTCFSDAGYHAGHLACPSDTASDCCGATRGRRRPRCTPATHSRDTRLTSRR